MNIYHLQIREASPRRGPHHGFRAHGVAGRATEGTSPAEGDDDRPVLPYLDNRGKHG